MVISAHLEATNNTRTPLSGDKTAKFKETDFHQNMHQEETEGNMMFSTQNIIPISPINNLLVKKPRLRLVVYYRCSSYQPEWNMNHTRILQYHSNKITMLFQAKKTKTKQRSSRFYSIHLSERPAKLTKGSNIKQTR